MKKILWLCLLLCSGCTTITAQKGDMTLSRTAFGVNLSIPELTVRQNGDQSFAMILKGATSDSAQAIQAAISGTLEGAKMFAKP